MVIEESSGFMGFEAGGIIRTSKYWTYLAEASSEGFE